MSHYTFRSSRPDQWVSPRPGLDPAVRAMAYGPVRSMYEPTWLERVFGRR